MRTRQAWPKEYRLLIRKPSDMTHSIDPRDSKMPTIKQVQIGIQENNSHILKPENMRVSYDKCFFYNSNNLNGSLY